MQLLLERPATLAELTAHVAAGTEFEDRPELRAHLDEALAQLQEMGLLARDGAA